MKQGGRGSGDDDVRELLGCGELAETPGSAARAALKAFLAFREDGARVPTRMEARAYLEALVAGKGRATAYAEFAWLQIAAAHAWGASDTSFFATVLRQFRVGEKGVRLSQWDRAEVAIAALPEEWRSQFSGVLVHSRDHRRRRRGAVTWSASHITAVSRALARWHRHCVLAGHDLEPSGQGFQKFAEVLIAEEVSARSIHSYLQRVYSGYSTVIAPGFQAPGCAFMIREYRIAAASTVAVTKTGRIAARDLYALGFELTEEARAASVRGLRAALTFRDGVMIALAVALPQRARALSAFELDATIKLDEFPSISINLPGAVLKLPEAQKRRESYTKTIQNPDLWEALSEYLSEYRPIFDDGRALFPSKIAPGQGLSEAQIGRHIGDVTLRRFGVRISVHRFRDSVATEAAEEMERGGVLTSALLGHRDLRTTQRHYDHSEGVRIAREFADLAEAMKGTNVDLAL